MPSNISRLDASASDFVAYKPPFSTSSTSSSTSKQDRSWQPYSKQDERWQPLSKNQRRKKNKRNPPQQSTFLPPTVADLIVPAQPQPSTFPEHEDDNYLTTWMNTYNPHLTNRISVSNLAINQFNYNGNFYDWCKKRGLGASAPSA